MLAARAMNQTL